MFEQSSTSLEDSDFSELFLDCGMTAGIIQSDILIGSPFPRPSGIPFFSISVSLPP